MIVVTFPDGSKAYCSYLEDIAKRLEEHFNREVYVSDYELQLEPPECDFIVYGVKFHYKQYEDE